jgi:CBS domain containing-hemolysin-like protein
MMIFLNLFIIVILIALTAMFVSTEFAIVKIRHSKIKQMVEENIKGAEAAEQVVSHLDEYLSACQLGITVTALGIGWIGESTIKSILHPLFVFLHLEPYVPRAFSIVLAFLIVTFLHVVIGELAPKTFAIQKAERITVMFSPFLIWFYRITYPFIWLLNHSARMITKTFGLHSVSEHEMAHSEEELRLLLSESYERGEINQSEFRYVDRIFEFDDRVAHEIMIPRTEMVAVNKNMTMKEFSQYTDQQPYTRYPVIEGDKDHVIGLINVKEALKSYVREDSANSRTIEELIKPIITVLDSIPVRDLLLKMQKERIHMAILFDEYGGTQGLVTVEDILEEIVGEIRDEFDVNEIPYIQTLSKTQYILDGKVLIEEVNHLLGISIEEDEVDTIGGYLLLQQIGDGSNLYADVEGYRFTPKNMIGNQIKSVEVNKIPAEH